MEKNFINSADKVLETLKARLGEDIDESKLALDIERARVLLLGYCNIPINAKVPQGLFEAWCMAAEQVCQGTTGEVASITEGDVSISFKKEGNDAEGLGWRTVADRFRRLAL